MEAIAAVASIGGIVQLTVHGIKLIKLLRRFARDCDNAAAEDFVQGLMSSAQLLQDVQTLCIRIQKHGNPNISQIRTATLHLQIEDCINDLEAWNSIVKRLESTAQKRDSRVNKWRMFESPAQIFLQFCRIAFKNAAAGTGTTQRLAIRACFEQHKNGVGVALSMLGSNLQLVNIEAFDNSKLGIDKLVDLTEAQERRQEHNYSDLRSSNSSILASTRKQEEKLDELRSIQSSISGKLDDLLLAFSSQSSQSASVSSDCAVEGSEQRQKVSQDGSALRQRPAIGYLARLNAEDAAHDFAKATELEESPIADPDSDSLEDGTDLKEVVSLFTDFHLLLSQTFDALVAEYVFAAEQWRIASIRGCLLGNIEKRRDASRFLMDCDLATDLPKIAASLLSLRRRAEVECLHESLGEADALLGIDSGQIDRWEFMAAQRNIAAGNDKLTLPKNSTVKSTESLIRMNEWMFTVMTSVPYLAAWHRSMTADLIEKSRRDPASVRATNNIMVPTMERNRWERMTIKLWLFDGSNLDGPGGYAASSFTDSRESELTVLAASSDEDDLDNELGTSEDVDQVVMLKQPAVDQRLLRGLKNIEVASEVNMPPIGVRPEVVERAKRALDSYEQEKMPLLRDSRGSMSIWTKAE